MVGVWLVEWSTQTILSGCFVFISFSTFVQESIFLCAPASEVRFFSFQKTPLLLNRFSSKLAIFFAHPKTFFLKLLIFLSSTEHVLFQKLLYSHPSPLIIGAATTGFTGFEPSCESFAKYNWV